MPVTIPASEGSIHPCDVTIGICIVPYFDYETEPLSAAELPDVITLGTGLLLSPRVSRLLSLGGCDEELVSLRTSVVNRKKCELAEYYYVCSKRSHNVLNESMSGAVFYPSGVGAIKEVRSWILDPRLAPPLELFFAHFSKWICSQQFAELCKRDGITGVDFLRLEVSDQDIDPGSGFDSSAENCQGQIASPSDRTNCQRCGRAILQRTADKHDGLCKRCACYG